MEANSSSNSTRNASSLRWKILKRAILGGPSSNSDNQSEVGIQRISRKATHSFNLIPCRVKKDSPEEILDSSLSEKKQLHSSRDAVFCYTLPVANAPQLLLQEWMILRILVTLRSVTNMILTTLGLSEIVHSVSINLKGQWPSEEVLAYYCLAHPDTFRQKSVIELGSGYGLAGLAVAMTTEALEVIISDGNPQVVGYIQHNINANFGGFGSTEVKPLMLHWGLDKDSNFSNKFDIIIASDCTFFKEFHPELVQTIKLLLKREVSSEAILFSPKRGDSLDKFLLKVKDSGLRFSVDEIYHTEVWKCHQGFVNGDDSWPNYEMDHCYPLLVRITW
ncbi:calmodulin-lysine N-methyltransferase isoform X1 [Nicotiana tomentosiformis]|uniref:calmodulin-lysine N-methyltransferase isoform X1 n=1 Tax=Nicotiana tomentosiformis TaxID=4098 RepID=UPI0008790F28|nr:calmodulin-lysine N-methyltransferase isoform X1 [Nicotiana tomentosiformis]